MRPIIEHVLVVFWSGSVPDRVKNSIQGTILWRIWNGSFFPPWCRWLQQVHSSVWNQWKGISGIMGQQQRWVALCGNDNEKAIRKDYTYASAVQKRNRIKKSGSGDNWQVGKLLIFLFCFCLLCGVRGTMRSKMVKKTPHLFRLFSIFFLFHSIAYKHTI